VSRDFGKFTKIVKKRDMSDHHASQTRARLLNSRVKSRLLPRYELMGSKGDKVDEKCFVFSVSASRTPSLFSPEGERERRKFNKFAKTSLTDDITRLIFLLKTQSYD
jgi:hypothetical protein